MNEQAKKFTADEQAFWDACAKDAMHATLVSMQSDSVFNGVVTASSKRGIPMLQVIARDAAVLADQLLTARRERGQ